MGKAVQLRGTPNIMTAFDSLEITSCALFYESRCLFKTAGESLDVTRAFLQGFLKKLEVSNTTAMYELRFYEDVKDRKKIKVSTEADYAYNVMLFDPEEYPSTGMVTRREGYALVLQELQDLKAQMAIQKQEAEEEDDEPEAVTGTSNILGFFNKLLDNQEVQNKIGQLVTGWMDKLLLPAPASNTFPMTTSNEAGAMGSIPGAQGQAMITQEQALKIQSSIEILAGIDPQLGDHLEKIAQLAQKSPGKYKTMISMLNSFV